MSKTLSYLKNYKLNLIFGPFFKLLEAIFELLVPLIMADLIDNGINNANATLGFILGRGGIMLALGVVGFGCSLLCQYIASKCSQGYGTDLRNGLYEHINKLSFDNLDKLGASALITRMTSDINQLQGAVAMLIRLVIRAPFLVIGSAIMAIIINPLLGTIFVVVAPLLGLCLFFIMRKSIPLYKKIQKNLDDTTQITQENLNGARVIRAFSKQDNQIEKFVENNAVMTKNNVKVGIISALLSPLSFAIVNLAIAAVIYFGGKIVNVGAMSQGQIIAFINYLMQISLAIVVVANLVTLYTRSYASAKRIEQVLTIDASTRPTLAVTPLKDCAAISFRQVCFGYSSNLVLSNINFEIFKGQNIGIIGGTGCGKSTIANLLAGFYAPTNGQILLCGVDINQYPQSQLVNMISFCMQNATIFSGTIRSNLLFACPNATDDDMAKALNIAQATEFVNGLDGGIDAVVTQNGKNLSGGQKQRLSIARAVLKHPDILIFDDSTSALDYITEANLLKALSTQLDSDTTKIFISQRINSLKKCDQILVVDGGAICGIGTHSTLISTCEVYKEIWRSQQKEGKK